MTESNQTQFNFNDVCTRAYKFLCAVFDDTQPLIAPDPDAADSFDGINFTTPALTKDQMLRQQYLMDISLEIVKKHQVKVNSSGDTDEKDMSDLRRQALINLERKKTL